MKATHTLFLLLIFGIGFLGLNCTSNNSRNNTGNSAAKSNEPLDSAYLEHFLQQHPEFKSQRKKLFKFYSRRNFTLAWYDKKDLVPQAGMFMNMLHNMENDGLPAGKYDFQKVDALYQKINTAKKSSLDPEDVKKLDLMLSASYFTYVKNLWRGAVNVKDEDIEWYVERKKIKYGKTLDAILESKGNSFSELEPLNTEYGKLKKALAEYREIQKQGGWPPINLTHKLAKGDTSYMIPQVRSYLAKVGDLKSAGNKALFDNNLEQGIKKFQQRHGLEEDGKLGGKTLEEMNVPVSRRIEQIIINMERWRWVPQNLSEKYLMVNIPEYKLRIFDHGKEVMNMNVIVGKAANSTPIFNDQMEDIVFNPYWNLPKSIVVNEMLPLLRKNPVIIEKENMEVYQGKPDNIIDPYSVDWNTINEDNLPYQIRQKPGGNNALGKIKFLFPNEYDVYLHDTPGHELFNQAQRGFSHGCIRLEHPKELAEYLLKNNPEWPSQKIDEVLATDEEKFVKLKEKLPVYILYFTSWVDDKGNINFRDDIYSHDEKLARSFFDKE